MIIDLRTAEEARSRPAHSDLVLDIPKPPLTPAQIGEMAEKLFAAVPAKGDEIVLFCAKGIRSALGAAMLRQAGRENVVDAGGIEVTA